MTTMIRRDRNHPSIIMWSIGNEIAERADEPTGDVIAKKLIATIEKYDTTRPLLPLSTHFGTEDSSVGRKTRRELSVISTSPVITINGKNMRKIIHAFPNR